MFQYNKKTIDFNDSKKFNWYLPKKRNKYNFIFIIIFNAFLNSGRAKPVDPFAAGRRSVVATAAPAGRPADKHATIRRPGKSGSCVQGLQGATGADRRKRLRRWQWSCIRDPPEYRAS